MMSPLENPNRCNGCGACSQKCPHGAILMQTDAEGFFRPQTDAEKCVECGLCAAVCPVNHPPVLADQPKAFAAYSKNTGLRHTSSSGGVFSELAAQILARGGAIVGAAMDPDGVVRHRIVESEATLAVLRGSKYVQSEAWHTYPAVKALLAEGREVLFSGTPCQVAGLSKYLGKPYDGLWLVDIVCHGVPSPKAWSLYLKERKKNAGTDVASAEFRNKASGWQNYSMRIRFADQTEYRVSLKNDPYLRAFLKNAILRPSCHQCASKGAQRASDLTLADFWGVTRCIPEMDAYDGVSLVLVNTPKGAALLDSCSSSLVLQETELEKALEANTAYSQSAAASPAREAFFAALDSTPFDVISARYCRDRLSEKLRRLAGAVKRRIFRR